ncbi:hypothetical protein NIES22_48290 [Calothrix brevissima NIES-22]|nr:hypothetical protein NIES22_48290 [Calothrix brevissima NIES-22]
MTVLLLANRRSLGREGGQGGQGGQMTIGDIQFFKYPINKFVVRKAFGIASLNA